MIRIYGVPDDMFNRLAFPRGRFLQQLEDDLAVFVQLIEKCGNTTPDEFAVKFDTEYAKYHGSSDKTIANHRTEMIALFGLTVIKDGLVKPSLNTQNLLTNQDFLLFFKAFCNKFQFPNFINKIQETTRQVNLGIKLKPTIFILQLLLEAEKRFKDEVFYISGAEISNLVFNDLRVAKGERDPGDVLGTIIEARKNKVVFPRDSNHTQHGREFLGYMTLANLLRTDETGRLFCLNKNEAKAIQLILQNEIHVDFPDNIDADDVRERLIREWNNKFKRVYHNEQRIFQSKIGDFDYLEKEITQTAEQEKPVSGITKPTDIGLLEMGDAGELLVLKKEREIISKVRPDKLGLVVRVSNDTSLGYDIQSLEADNVQSKKFIEVKTTTRTFLPSEDILTFFPMSANEWETARSYRQSYYIHRVFLTANEASVHVVKDPIAKEEQNEIILEPLDYRVVLKKGAIDEVYSIKR